MGEYSRCERHRSLHRGSEGGGGRRQRRGRSRRRRVAVPGEVGLQRGQDVCKRGPCMCGVRARRAHFVRTSYELRTTCARSWGSRGSRGVQGHSIAHPTNSVRSSYEVRTKFVRSSYEIGTHGCRQHALQVRGVSGWCRHVTCMETAHGAPVGFVRSMGRRPEEGKVGNIPRLHMCIAR